MIIYAVIVYDPKNYQILRAGKHAAILESERKANIERDYRTENNVDNKHKVLAILDTVVHNYIMSDKETGLYFLSKQMMESYPLDKGRLPDWMYKESDITCPNCNHIFKKPKKQPKKDTEK